MGLRKTPVAQGGANLSGGQKQRLAIARAAVRSRRSTCSTTAFRPWISRRARLRARAGQGDGRTPPLLIVAQRVSTIMNAEKIVVLDGGGLAGIGNHRSF